MSKFLSSIQEEAKGAFDVEMRDASSASLRFIALHEKFCRHLTTAALQLRKAEKELNDIRRKKHEWYIKEYDIRLDRKELEVYVSNEPEVIEAEDKVSYWKASAKYIEGILDGISKASYNLGNAIKWEVFKGGG